MRIAVCDDKKEITKQMEEYLLSMKDMAESKLEVFVFNDADDFLYDMVNSVPYDAVFMDIDLGKSNGIDLAKRIYENYGATMIAFITGYRQFIGDVFAVQPCGFIEKPILRDKVKEVFENIVKKCDDLPKLIYKVNGSVKCSLLREII